MKKFFLLLVTLTVVLGCSECVLEKLSSEDYSGFGFASGLCFPQGEVMFTIYSSQTKDCSAVLRCRCLHLNDAGQSLIIKVNGVENMLDLEETTDWQELTVNLSLQNGNNSISLCKSRALFYDICIDYIELQ